MAGVARPSVANIIGLVFAAGHRRAIDPLTSWSRVPWLILNLYCVALALKPLLDGIANPTRLTVAVA